MKVASLEKAAIEAATTGAWQRAIGFNRKILQIESKNIPALNRLARACLENCELSQAKQAYEKVLTIDQFNHIAIKNLQRLAGKKDTRKMSLVTQRLAVGSAFVEEPRKTKIIRVIRLTSPSRLAEVNCGDEVFLTPKKHFVAITSLQKTHLGCLPEDISQRLATFIRGGNRYQAFVKTIENNDLEVIIKETYRNRIFKNLPSF